MIKNKGKPKETKEEKKEISEGKVSISCVCPTLFHFNFFFKKGFCPEIISKINTTHKSLNLFSVPIFFGILFVSRKEEGKKKEKLKEWKKKEREPKATEERGNERNGQEKGKTEMKKRRNEKEEKKEEKKRKRNENKK